MSGAATTRGGTLHTPHPTSFDVASVRRDFPALSRLVHGKPLVYLDSAATSQKPQVVIDAVRDHDMAGAANIHRGVHLLSVEATQAYENARTRLAKFLGANQPEEIVFVRGATEAINLVAQSFGRTNLSTGDEVLITEMEHHSNIVPWQMLCEQTGAILKAAPINDAGEIRLDDYRKLLNPRTKVVAMTHVSNALGTINPLREMIDMARSAGAVTVIDGAQAAPHLPVNISEIGCDFYAVSGHKMFGPSGIGALYGRKELLDAMPPYQGGGEMILAVSIERSTYNHVPHKFEAGTPNITGAIGLGAAADYLERLGMDHIASYEQELLRYATAALLDVPRLHLIGTADHKAAVLSFTLGDIHPHDVGAILDEMGVAVRTGHHCAQPVMTRFGVPATTRASLAFYNTKEEIDALAAGLRAAVDLFQ